VKVALGDLAFPNLARQVAFRHALLQDRAVDQKRRQQRLEAVHADGVVGAGVDFGQLYLAGLDVGDGGLVVGELVVKPPVGDRDAERPAGASLDLLDLALDIVRALLVVGEGEHDR
jgi:hypothetical protein